MKTITIDDKKIEISDESYEAFKKQFVTKDKAILWKPNKHDRYWYTGIAGNKYTEVTWSCDDFDQRQYQVGNIFKTKEEAQEALDTGWVAKRKAEVKILRFIAENDLEFESDWSSSKDKYCIYYAHHYGKFDYGVWANVQYSPSLYFKSREDARKVIDAMTPELKILFGVK